MSIKAVIAVNKMQRLSQALAKAREIKANEEIEANTLSPLDTLSPAAEEQVMILFHLSKYFTLLTKHYLYIQQVDNNDETRLTDEVCSEVDYSTDLEMESPTKYDGKDADTEQFRYAELLEEER